MRNVCPVGIHCANLIVFDRRSNPNFELQQDELEHKQQYDTRKSKIACNQSA